MTNQQLLDKIEELLAVLRPTIAMDGGDIQLVKFEQGIVYVKLHGACVHCPASTYTLKLGIEQTLKAQLPQVREVVPIDEDESER